MLVMISEQPRQRHKAFLARLEKVLGDVRACVDDWRAMRRRCRELIRDLEKRPPRLPREEIAEGIAFLEWLDDDHFTYLGYREYSFVGSGSRAMSKIDPDSSLGLLRDKDFSIFQGLRNLGKLPADVQSWVKTPEVLRIAKSNQRSSVHRDAHLDAVAIKMFNRKGEVIGERLFVGLFTSTVYSRSPRSIPVLRRKVDNTIARAGLVPGSHDGKALLHILDTYPRDELFQATEAELAEIAIGVLHLQERQRTALFVRRDPFERFLSCLIYVPRDRFDTRLRYRLQGMVTEAYNGVVAAFHTTLGDSPLARLHLIIRIEQGKVPEVDTAELEERMALAARSWSDRMEQALTAEFGEETGLILSKRYGSAFPTNYQEAFVPRDAVADIRCLEQALDSGKLAMDLYRPHNAANKVLHFKIYVAGDPVPLSEVLPILENMGLWIIGEVPYEVHPEDSEKPIWIHDFDMSLKSGGALDIAAIREAFHEVFERIWTKSLEDDNLNKLVLVAGLNAREIEVLRAYSKYLRQARIPFSQRYMAETLVRNPKLTRLLTELFWCRFDPARSKRDGVRKAAAAAQKLSEKILRLLDEVSNLDEDRIIRRYRNVILSTLRTNYFQRDEGGNTKPYMSLKFDAQAVDDLPKPRPFREIFVYSPRVEGVHLRFGLVARGGLRWSDRREDFRTEILGLVKAQQVKNAVIVPVGSKGGFFAKQLPPPQDGREAWLAEGIESYKTFLRGLLDITDNLKGSEVVAPKDTLRYDGDDPYLVVAADKGTATFSDIANGVSAEYGFWLDDAFASGGSAGYDHKAMGITARGAWESVKRHFREIGTNIQEEDFTVVGVGDMGGDVFGNGMLLSPHIRLVAAFNHMHIFIDPNPDAKASWAERKRLFELPRSSWADYDSKLISKGGQVFERKSKSIKITPEMKKRFGITEDALAPIELIRALLKSEVDLLWFGGIGTYVKAQGESHSDVGDHANDALRIEAAELRVKVVGEGANLGMTQRARIEYGLRGGRSNTDAIDNSAGVDCSDHEVNIKILLGAIEESGKLSRRQRDKLLVEMTDEVAELVLRDNYLQTQSITVTQELGRHLLDRLGRYMRSLERSGRLDRALEFLPDEEVLTDRLNQGLGLTRAEISVLVSYAKLTLYGELLPSDVPDDPCLTEYLMRYFPTPLRERYAKQIAGHRLRREIIATQATNYVVNRMGITFIHEVQEKTGMPAGEIVRAYIIVRDILGIRSLWQQIEALDNKVSAAVQAAMIIECGRLIERVVVWLLRDSGGSLDVTARIEELGPDVTAIVDNLGRLLQAPDQQALAQEQAALVESGVPEELARRIASLKLLSPACDIARLAKGANMPVLQTGEIYFSIGGRFGFDWLRRAAGRLSSDSAWDKLAITAIVDDLYGYQYDLSAKVIKGNGEPQQVDGTRLIDNWAEQRRPLVARNEQLLTELQAVASPDLAMLAVANRQLKSLVGG
jgi:glutamate dehydrogenase